MRNTIFRLSIVLFVILCTFKISIAQELGNEKFSGRYQSLPFKSFAEEIEKQTKYRFFYNPLETDTLKITLAADSLTISELLQKALESTEFKFSVDYRNFIFVTNKNPVIVNLPENFFKSADENLVKNKKSADLISEQKTKIYSAASLENKLYTIGDKKLESISGKASVAGIVKDVDTGEPILGASIEFEGLNIGAFTDQFGYYSLSLPKGNYVMLIRS